MGASKVNSKMGTGLVPTLFRILKPVPVVLIIWCVLWANFTARDLYKKGKLKDYKILLKSNAEGKHAFVYGRRFFEFLEFAKSQMPESARFDLIGFGDFSLDGRRAMYYLYPRLRAKNPEYILRKLDNGEFVFEQR